MAFAKIRDERWQPLPSVVPTVVALSNPANAIPEERQQMRGDRKAYRNVDTRNRTSTHRRLST